MPLSIRYVRSLEDVIDPAADFLSRPVDLFARPRVVVPTAGAKAWLTATLAERLGATRTADGTCFRDGIVANVDFSYPATISTLLSATPRNDSDPWEVNRLTFTILALLKDDNAYQRLVKRAAGPLLAARRIADRFDHYHFRRPGMILAWEEGNARLSPSADAEGSAKTTAIGLSDRWQFDLWRAVRKQIGEPSPPARERVATGPVPDAVLVAGLQGLSLHQIELLARLAEMPTASDDRKQCDVQVVLVHPSPVLREAWADAAPGVSLGLAPIRGEPPRTPVVDPLVDAWLRGAREAQWLLASQGHHPAHEPSPSPLPSPPPPNAPLLKRLQHTVATGHAPPTPNREASPVCDVSVRIHRCHDLGRQAEVLHDAILHAFSECSDLAPHHVVIVSPQIAKLAPHLEAVFNRSVTGKTSSDDGASLEIPLLVADRGIREVSRGAELLAAVIELVGSRCSVDSMLAVAAHPLVLEHHGLDDEAVEDWRRCIEHTKIRWGIDPSRRKRQGLDQSDLRAHTWRLGLERMLLGTVIPDGVPEPVLGGVVPLPDVDTADIKSLAPLVSIFRIIDDLDQQTSGERPVAEWCDLLEKALEHLAGDENDELFVPLREMDVLRQAAAADTLDTPAPYHDVKTILSATLAAPIGHQPLRTGVVTATSMIPLRGVPFRVVCLAGFDDDALSPREQDSEDLVNRQDLLGDADSRLDVRRGLLDCMLAAKDRLVITCTGMDVKNNATRPLVTPLAEFTDFVARHGIPSFERDGEKHCGIEVFHPRHACSRQNFVTGDAAVIPGTCAWSHDASALAAADALGKEVATPGAEAEAEGIEPPTHIELEWLAEFMHDPLWPYVKKTLGISTWHEEDLSTPATLPLELMKRELRNLRDDYIERLLETDASRRQPLAAAWEVAVKTNGDVPVLGYGDDAIAKITQFSDALLKLAVDQQVPLDQGELTTINVDLDGIRLSGTIERWYPDQQTIVLLRPDAMKPKQFVKPKMLAVVQQLALRASGQAVAQAIAFNQHEKWFPGALQPSGRPVLPAQARRITLDPAISDKGASEILLRLCRLYQLATTKPHAACGDASKEINNDRAAARDEFDACFSRDSHTPRNETVVYGAQPDFDDVFPESRGLEEFFSQFHALTSINNKYVYTPQ
jgi:exodeoxyribonuclease V gamma subunit